MGRLPRHIPGTKPRIVSARPAGDNGFVPACSGTSAVMISKVLIENIPPSLHYGGDRMSLMPANTHDKSHGFYTVAFMLSYAVIRAFLPQTGYPIGIHIPFAADLYHLQLHLLLLRNT